jgi:hypothetical protein
MTWLLSFVTLWPREVIFFDFFLRPFQPCLLDEGSLHGAFNQVARPVMLTADFHDFFED